METPVCVLPVKHLLTGAITYLMVFILINLTVNITTIQAMRVMPHPIYGRSYSTCTPSGCSSNG